MAAITYTFLDAKNEVYTLLYGQQFAETEAGIALINSAINRAQAEVPATLGTLMFAGSLYNTATYAAAGGDTYDMTATAWLCPIAAEIKDGAATYAQASKVEPERILRHARTAISSKEYLYSFLGNNLWVRPIIPTGGSALVYGLKVPTALTADANTLEADPRLFRAICLRAAWIAKRKFPSEDPQKFDQLKNDMADEMGRLETLVKKAQLEEYALRTGRDVLFGGQAPGQGG